MQQNMSRAELAAALGVSEAKVTAMTVDPPRHGMKPVPAYEPSRYDLERTVEVGRIGDQHVVFHRTKIWGDRRQIHSSAASAVICASAEEARQRADELRISGALGSVPQPASRRPGRRA